MDKNYYRSLLLRYMAHVIDVEGYSFVDMANFESTRNIPLFTENDVDELKVIEQEALTVFKDI
jgi:hypothetical protein